MTDINLQIIFAEFKSLPLSEKVSYLSKLETLNLPYDINYQSLIAAWAKLS